MSELSAKVNAMMEQQLKQSELFIQNYDALGAVKVKDLKVGEAHFRLQFNPARIRSSAAKVDAKAIAARKCFLCQANRPSDQMSVAWGSDYEILVNPYPIFPKHLTIPCLNHVDQLIATRIGDMMRLARKLEEYILFYNGPKCGASAPDHMHFQAGNKGFMTFDADLANAPKEIIIEKDRAKLSLVTTLARTAFIVEGEDVDQCATLFEQLLAALPKSEDDKEPMLNILCWAEDDKCIVAVFPRTQHRPSCYFAEGDDNILITPASVDMGGVFIAPLEKDFIKVEAADIAKILGEVTMSAADAKEVAKRLKNR